MESNNDRRRIDLHVHSTASDGSLAPSAIAALAQKAGLAALALTDHDAVDGVRTLMANPALLGEVRFLSGVEISAESSPFPDVDGSFHILGYGFDPWDPELDRVLRAQQSSRKNRNPNIIKRLNQLGMEITLQEVVDAAEPGAQIGRPHIARLLVAKGFVGGIHEAFERYLGMGKPAYLEKVRIDASTAIERILAAGGVPVLAHPGLLNMKDEAAYDRLFSDLKALGLMGVEVWYPGHDPGQTEFFLMLAKNHGLLLTGGSDFHGAVNPEIALGVGRGDLDVPYAVYEILARAVADTRAARGSTA